MRPRMRTRQGPDRPCEAHRSHARRTSARHAGRVRGSPRRDGHRPIVVADAGTVRQARTTRGAS
jgi:hypothetical protein